MVLEYCNKGTLYDMMKKQADNRLNETTARTALQQLMSALQYLREGKRVPIIHRDIKPENVLVSYDKATKTKTYKLGDFGWAVQHVPSSVRDTLCGTPEYLPPEVCRDERYSGGFDIWTLGILLFEMLAGKTPFSSESEKESEHTMEATMERIKAGAFTVPPCIPTSAGDLIRRMLVLDPAKRISLRAAMEHPWLQAEPGAGRGRVAASGKGVGLKSEAVASRSGGDKGQFTSESVPPTLSGS